MKYSRPQLPEHAPRNPEPAYDAYQAARASGDEQRIQDAWKLVVLACEVEMGSARDAGR